tara:strand:- start:38 stop:634 length:597 start_codon:yes stop_codon:yes gene_type:complete
MDLNNIISNLEFKNITNVNYEDVLELLKIRNKENVRNKMFNKKYITRFDHNSWLKKIKKTSKEDFYIIYYKHIVCGGLGIKNYDNKLKECDWAFYISDNFNFPGLGASIEFKSINFLLKKYKLSRLYCYVLKNNPNVIKLHKKFFFLKVPILIKKLNDYNINISKNNIIKFCLDLKRWKSESKKLVKKLKIHEKKSQY